jgi:hypothetical protein
MQRPLSQTSGELVPDSKVDSYPEAGVLVLEGLTPETPVLLVQQIDWERVLDSRIYFGDSMKNPIVGPALGALAVDVKTGNRGDEQLAIRADVDFGVWDLRNRVHPDYAWVFLRPGEAQDVRALGSVLSFSAIRPGKLSVNVRGINSPLIAITADALKGLLATDLTPAKLSDWQQQGLGFQDGLDELHERIAMSRIPNTKWAFVEVTK